MKLALFFQLGGDIDVLAPFLSGLGTSAPRIIASQKLLAENPRLKVLLDSHGLRVDAVLGKGADDQALRHALGDCSHLLTSSETTLKPHALAHALTIRANELGLLTATLQHGVENVGLTYFDEHQGPEVKFAAQLVLTWNGRRSLLAGVCDETSSKVRDVGLPSSMPANVFGDIAAKLDFEAGDRPVVGIFENLHWSRYSETYRHRFLDDLQDATERFPNLVFVTKPHHEGRWLTERYKGSRPENSNLVVLDPKSADWQLLTAPSLMPKLAGVITTPSKVALDASLADLPVALVSYDGLFPFYRDLYPIQKREDWSSFLSELSESVPSKIEGRSSAYVNSTVSSVDLPERVLAVLKNPGRNKKPWLRRISGAFRMDKNRDRR